MTTRQSLIFPPIVRFARTVIQVIGAMVVAAPVALAAIPAETDETLYIVGVVGALVAIVSAGQNAWEASRDSAAKPGAHLAPASDSGQSYWAGLVVILLLLVIIFLATGRI